MIKFEEVYENSSDVTTIGAESWSDCMLFMPISVRAGEDFETDYLVDYSGHKFLSRGEDGDLLYKYGIGMELRTLYACVSPWVKADAINNKGTEIITDIACAGWGMFIISDTSMPTYPMDAAQTQVSILLSSINYGGAVIYSGPFMTVLADLGCYKDVKCLGFVGDLGEEVVVFRGLHSREGRSEKVFFRSVRRVKKVLKAYKYFRHKLRTLREPLGVRLLLHELTYTEEDVWLFDEDETAGYKEVTVIDDDVQITDRNELLESAIDIEYYE